MVIWEVLMRCSTPYQGMDPAQIITAVLVTAKLPPVPDGCCPGVPQLVVLLHRCRDLDPEQVSQWWFPEQSRIIHVLFTYYSRSVSWVR
jgi:hypothetical protein